MLHTTAELSVQVATICLLAFFAVLVIWGISDSANVALVMFVGHLTTMLVLIGYCIKHAAGDISVFHENLDSPFPDITADNEVIAPGNAATALFFGFASALLGACLPACCVRPSCRAASHACACASSAPV